MKQMMYILGITLVCAGAVWAGQPATPAPMASPYEDGRLTADSPAGAGVVPQGGPRSGITIDVYASSAPNAHSGASSWAGYVPNALYALENNLATNGNRLTDPTAYERAPAVVPPGEIAVTSFKSWRGVVEPPAPFNNEYGNRMHFGLHAYGDGTTQFTLENLTFELHSSDPWDSLVFVGDFIGYGYSATRYGIDWVDGIKGNENDITYTSGNGTTPVDEIVYVGVGNAWWPGYCAAPCNPADPPEGKQGAMDDYLSWLAADGPINVTCTYAIGSNTGSDSVMVEQVVVDEIGSSGWMSDDTRGPSGTDLVGINYTHYGKPGQTPTAGHDVAIANQIQFVLGPDDVTALKLTKTSQSGGYSKSTISTVDEDGFATNDWRAGFFANYRYYATSSAEVGILKLGVQSAAWAQSQAGFTASRSGESVWDLVLVDWRGTDPPWTVNAWDRFNTNADTACWRVYRQAGNSFFNAPPGGMLSLNQLAADTGIACTISGTPYTWGQVLFGTGTKVTSIQFGVGSSVQSTTSYIDYLETSLLNGGARVDFWGPAPVTIAAYPSQVPDEQDPRVNLGDAPIGFGPDSWQNSATGKVNWHARYLADGDYLSDLFPGQAAALTLNDIASIRYWTKRPAGTAAGRDWWVYIYTRPPGDASWYGKRFINNYNEHTNIGSWVQYSTDNDMTFRRTSGTPTALMSFDDLKTGYGTELIEMISVQTDSGWSGGFDGYMDGLVITLTDGSVGKVDFVRQPTLTLEPDDECYAAGETVTVELWMHDVPETISGGQFFLAYNTTYLTLPDVDCDPGPLFDDCSITPGEPPFTVEVNECSTDHTGYQCTPTAGLIDYAVGIPFGGTGASGSKKMAVLTFTANQQICSVADLITWRLHDPPTRLSDSLGQPVYPDPVAMEVIDNEPPTITTAASDLTVECDGAGNAGDLSAWLAGHGGAAATDNCGSVTWTDNFMSLSDDCCATGSVTVTFTATDDCDNFSTTSATFTIVDTTPPTISTAASNLTIECDGAGNTTQLNNWLNTHGGAAASDVCCDSDITWTHNFSELSDNCCATGAATVTFTATDGCGKFSTTTATFTIVDTTAPTVSGCPVDITINAEAGGCTAVVNWTEPTATDVCCGSVPWTTRSHDPGSTFSQGMTTVTYTFTDGCGNSATCTFTVTVLDVNDVSATVDFTGIYYDPDPFNVGTVLTLTRCITFEIWSCSGPPIIRPVPVTFTITDGSVAPGTANFTVPCGSYTCITARDKRHTLRRTATPTIVGTQYTADFTGADELIGGNLNDDYWIDILDFGVFSSQWAVNYGSGDTTCSTPYPHADVNGDGLVASSDFTFIQVNFLKSHEPNCCGASGFRSGDEEGAEGPIMEISVAELHQRGLGDLAVADLNGDGMVDQGDIASFLLGERPAPAPEFPAPPNEVVPSAKHLEPSLGPKDMTGTTRGRSSRP